MSNEKFGAQPVQNVVLLVQFNGTGVITEMQRQAHIDIEQHMMLLVNLTQWHPQNSVR
jgi:hypothetical protein